MITLREPSRAASAPVDANHSLRVAGVHDSHHNAGAGVSQAARMRVGAHRPFSGQTIDASPRVRGQDCYTSPTVRGLSGETPEHPHTNLPASPDVPSRERSGGAGRQSIHSSPCTCGDDAQRHYALIARDLMAAGREDDLTDDMRQAYDYEFGGVPEPEPQQVPEF